MRMHVFINMYTHEVRLELKYIQKRFEEKGGRERTDQERVISVDGLLSALHQLAHKDRHI